MSVEGYPDDFESQQHTQDEWDDYERWKIKNNKSGKIQDYQNYKKNLKWRNLTNNFKNNTIRFAKAVAPTLKQLGENAAANADSLVDGTKPTATKGKKNGTNK